jgi:hypothetical protein
MSSVDWSPELAASLDELIPLGDGTRADWGDVVSRAGTPRRDSWLGRRPASRRLRVAIVVALVFLALAGVATATYFALRSTPRGLIFPRTREHSYAVLDANGRAHNLWSCPPRWFCDEVAGAALSRNGKQLAISFNALTVWRPNIGGMHIVDLATGADHTVPAVRVRGETMPKSLRSLPLRQRRTFGCFVPGYFSWSPDDSVLAYTCEGLRARVYTIRPDGTGRHLIATRTRGAYAPSWSPDGKRIAFSSCRFPFVDRTYGQGRPPCRSSLYVVDHDGRHEQRLAAGAFPDWSPDGRTIAYVTPGCGHNATGWRIRLVTPDGRDATPSSGACDGIGPPESVAPAWSPDGRRIAITTPHALYVMNANGSGLERILRGNFLGRGVGGLLRPFWQPTAKGQR